MENYEKKKLLGTTGFGKVHIVEEKSTKRLLGMKLINVVDKNDIDALAKEVDKMTRLSKSHPNIVNYERNFYDESEKSLVIIMEYCYGKSLRKVIEDYTKNNRNIPEETIKDYLFQILLGISFLHDNKIIHGDIKTENILIDHKGRLKISDFGIATVLNKAQQIATTSISTMYYSAPEILSGAKYDYSADIWSFGCILHELCCLTRPYASGDLSTQMESIRKDPYSPAKINNAYSMQLKNLIASMIVIDPNKRVNCLQILRSAPVLSFMGTKYFASQDAWLKNLLAEENKLQAHSNNGEIQNEIRTMTLSDGRNYCGEWKNDMMNGNGIIFYSNGDICIGNWKNSKINGNITFWDSDGAYSGDWENDNYNGQGVKTYNDGGRYNGEWVNGKRHGKGIMNYSNKSIYDGKWAYDQRSGYGIMEYSDCSKYYGEWANDQCSGKGKEIFSNRAEYNGEWANNSFHGEGTYRYDNGDMYYGQWANHGRNGKGIQIYNDGRKYYGEWRFDKQSGKGVLYFPDGTKHYGNWGCSKRNGMVLSFFSNGERHYGNQNDGVFDGDGIHWLADGNVYNGKWKKGSPTTEGKIFYISGSKGTKRAKETKKTKGSKRT